jgi:hypothetical protein
MPVYVFTRTSRYIYYYPRFHVTTVGLGTYYPRIRGHICICILSTHVGPDSPIGIATRYGLGGIESRWGKNLPRPHRPALGPTQPPIHWIPGLSRG